MFTLFSVVSGAITALTVMQNGQLAAFYGDFSAAVMIHLLGLIVVLIWYAAVCKKLPKRQKAPLWMFMGGVVGVGTTVFINMAYAGVGVTAIVALGLLGQTLTSIVVDQLGLFGTQKHPFFAGRIFPVLAVAAGAAVMIFPIGETSLSAVLLALCSGVTIVLARVINGRLAQYHGPMRSTVMNYVTGLCTTTLLMLAVGRGEPAWTGFSFSDNWFMYLGGPCGVMLIMLLNMTVPHVPSFVFTLLQFTGQIFTGLLLDTLLQGSFSWQSAIGGACVAAGLTLDAYLSKRQKKQPEAEAGE